MEPLGHECIEAIGKRLEDATIRTWGPGKIPGTIVAAVKDATIKESGVVREIT